jgi:hypothetical protein
MNYDTLPELMKQLRDLEGMALGVSLTRRVKGDMGRRLLWCNGAYAAFAGRSIEELLEAGDMRKFQARLHCPGQSRRLQYRIENGRPYRGRYYWLRHGGLHLAMSYKSWPIETREGIFVLGMDLPLPHEEADPEYPGLRLSVKNDGWFMN